MEAQEIARQPSATMPSFLGRIGSVARSLFRSPTDAATTIICLLILWFVIPPFIQWAVIDAAWTGSGGEACSGVHAACWVFVRERLNQFIFGTYPGPEQWRVLLVFLAAGVGLTLLLLPRVPGKGRIAAVMLTVFPVSTAILLGGGVLGLNPVSTSRWGGLTLTLVVATWGIVTSIPAGMALALGRQSSMPIIKHACAIYIEFWRGIPLLGVLFMAATMFPLFMPAGVEFDKLLRALIAFTLFNSAYMAEVFRGGLQAIGRGQYEASTALSLPYWTAVRRIIMPQALRIAIPSLVNTCITIFKQSSIFLTIGLYEFLGMIQAGTADPEWVRVSEVLQTGYVFAAIVYWAFCFSMSRYSRYIERSQGTTHH